MSFRRTVSRLSELVADQVIGAILQTAESGYFIKIWETVSGGVNNGLIQFFMGNPQALDPGSIVTTATVDPTGATFDLVDLTITSPTTTRFSNPAAIDMSPNLAGVVGTVRVLGQLDINPLNSPGHSIQGIDFDTVNGDVTDANGAVTVFHSLNVNPRTFQVQVRGNTPRTALVFSISSTQVVIRFKDSTGAALAAGISVSYFWLALC